MTRSGRLAELKRMVAAHDHTGHHLARIVAALHHEAQAMTIRDRPKRRQYGRGRATWTGADKRYYRSRLSELEAGCQCELGTLRNKLARQRCAIDRLVRKLRLDDPPRLMAPPVIYPDP